MVPGTEPGMATRRQVFGPTSISPAPQELLFRGCARCFVETLPLYCPSLGALNSAQLLSLESQCAQLTLINNETILGQILPSDATPICSQQKQHFGRVLPDRLNPRLVAKVQSSYLACNPIKQYLVFNRLASVSIIRKL